MPDFVKIINPLEQERDHLTDAIEAIRALAANKPRRGRPPKWMAASKKRKEEKSARKRKPGRPRKRVTARADGASTAVAAAG